MVSVCWAAVVDGEGFRLTWWWVTMFVLGALWAGIWIKEFFDRKREALRTSDPHLYLTKWKKKNRIAPHELGTELEAECPSCSSQLYGRDLSQEEVSSEAPPPAWRRCPACSHTSVTFSSYPWTKKQADEVRAEEERQQRLEAERQLIHAELERRRLRQMATLEGLQQTTPSQFEHAVAEILAKSGYSDVQVVGGAGDLAVDIICTDSDGKKVAVQCKQYTTKPVGSKELQTFIGMMKIHHRIRKGIYVTTSLFTKPATELAGKHRIELIDQTALIHLAHALMPPEPEVEIESLEAWGMMLREQERARQEARKRAEEKERERRRRARYYAGYSRSRRQ